MTFALNFGVMRLFPVTPLARALPFLIVLTGLMAFVPAEAQPSNLEAAGISYTADAYLSGAGASNDATVRVEMFGRVLVLTLLESGVVSPASRIVEIGDGGVETAMESEARHYRGHVEGEPDSWVRLSESEGQFAGLIKSGGEIFVIEPSDLWGFAQTSSSHVAYRLDEAELDAEVACGAAHSVDTRSKRRHRARRRVVAETSAGDHGAALQGVGGGFTITEIAVVGDYEYFASANWPGGYTAGSWMNAVVNAVSGIYEQDASISFTVATNTVYTTVNDPFPLTPTGTGCQAGMLAGDVLAEFAGTRSSGQYPWSSASSDVAHLFTGRPLCGSSGSNPQNVIGIAHYNGICTNNAGVSEDWSTGIGSMSILVAHELGHNFNAPHVSNCSPHPCCVMQSGLGGSCVQDRFSSSTASTITDYAAGRSCLDSGPPPTPTDTFTPSNTPTPTQHADPDADPDTDVHADGYSDPAAAESRARAAGDAVEHGVWRRGEPGCRRQHQRNLRRRIGDAHRQ